MKFKLIFGLMFLSFFSSFSSFADLTPKEIRAQQVDVLTFCAIQGTTRVTAMYAALGHTAVGAPGNDAAIAAGYAAGFFAEYAVREAARNVAGIAAEITASAAVGFALNNVGNAQGVSAGNAVKKVVEKAIDQATQKGKTLSNEEIGQMAAKASQDFMLDHRSEITQKIHEALKDKKFAEPKWAEVKAKLNEAYNTIKNDPEVLDSVKKQYKKMAEFPWGSRLQQASDYKVLQLPLFRMIFGWLVY